MEGKRPRKDEFWGEQVSNNVNDQITTINLNGKWLLDIGMKRDKGEQCLTLGTLANPKLVDIA